MLIVLLFDLVFDTVFILFIYLTLRGGGSLMSYIFRLMSYIFCLMSYIYIQSENVIFTQHKWTLSILITAGLKLSILGDKEECVSYTYSMS